MSNYVPEILKNEILQNCKYYYFIQVSTNIYKYYYFIIQVINNNFNIKKLLQIKPLIIGAKGIDIFEALKKCILDFDSFKKCTSAVTDGVN